MKISVFVSFYFQYKHQMKCGLVFTHTEIRRGMGFLVPPTPPKKAKKLVSLKLEIKYHIFVSHLLSIVFFH